MRLPPRTATTRAMPALTSAQRLRSVLSGTVGNLVEWYDWYAYTFLSLYFAPVFFPSGDPVAQQLSTAVVFAVGFVARPIGGWWLGRLSDARGRKAGLVASILLMGAGSLLIALTPGADRIGIAAPILLVFARLLQGLSVGGEFGASAAYLAEIASTRHRGFWASFQYVTLVGGQLIALAVLLLLQAVLSEAQISAWGWRVPFGLGAVLALSGLWLRRAAAESPVYEAGDPALRAKTAPMLRRPGALIAVAALSAGGTVSFYAFTTYMQKYLVNGGHWTKAAATQVSAVALLLYVIALPLLGALSDRVGRLTMVLAAGALGLVLTVPLMTAIGDARSFTGALLPLLAALAIQGLFSSVSGLVKAEFFGAGVRASGVALGHSLGVALFGGTTETVALWLDKHGHHGWFPVYVSAAFAMLLAVGLASAARIRAGRIEQVA